MWVPTIILFVSTVLVVHGSVVNYQGVKEKIALDAFTELLRSELGNDANAAVALLKKESFSQVPDVAQITVL